MIYESTFPQGTTVTVDIDYINQTTYENNQSDLELITKIEKFIKKCSNFSKEKFDVWDQILEAIDSRISVKRLNIRSLKR